MDCPHCKAGVPDGAKDCPACGVNFVKLALKLSAPVPARIPGTVKEPVDPRRWIPHAAAALVALYFASRFRSYLPLPQGYADLTRWLLPLSALNLAFHEAGHMIFGLFGFHFLMIAGGTLTEWAMPAACLVHFHRQGSRAGVLAMMFWIGLALLDSAYYAADAKMQVIILITGASGSEGGGHDWGYMLGEFGLKNYSVGIGRILFFGGCWLMAFAPLQGLWTLFGPFRRVTELGVDGAGDKG